MLIEERAFEKVMLDLREPNRNRWVIFEVGQGLEVVVPVAVFTFTLLFNHKLTEQVNVKQPRIRAKVVLIYLLLVESL